MYMCTYVCQVRRVSAVLRVLVTDVILPPVSGYQVAYGHINRTDKEQFVTVDYGANNVRGRVSLD